MDSLAALFRLENSREFGQVQEVLARLVEWLATPEQASLRRAFAVWVQRVILAKVSPEPVSAVGDLEEMRAMLADRFEEWAENFKREARRQALKEGRQKGRQEGRQKGRQEGRQQGEASLLRRQLRKRFGELPAWVCPRLERASIAELERWGERLLDAHSLEEVFDTE